MTAASSAEPSPRALGESLAALAAQLADLRGEIRAINERLDQAGLRADLNLPVKDGRITDMTRIERLVPTIRELADAGARVIVCSHFDRPKGKRVPEMSLKPMQAALSAALGVLPLLTFFATLLGLRLKAWQSGLAALVVALLVAVLGFHMPAHLAALAAAQGATFGLFPIVWIVVMALWFYQVTVLSGRFDDMRAIFDSLGGGDIRIQAVLIAFCFGGMLEALAGFGAPVAITATMVLGLGVPPLRAATAVLLANTAPVAFGAVGTPITTAGTLTGIPATHIGAIVGHQAPFVAVFVPFLLVFIIDGLRGVRQTWPALIVIGASFAVAIWPTTTSPSPPPPPAWPRSATSSRTSPAPAGTRVWPATPRSSPPAPSSCRSCSRTSSG